MNKMHDIEKQLQIKEQRVRYWEKFKELPDMTFESIRQELLFNVV